ncbi:MAG: hypothetical protein ABI207_07935, partial [Crocinitomicaceae bacterium]
MSLLLLLNELIKQPKVMSLLLKKRHPVEYALVLTYPGQCISEKIYNCINGNIAYPICQYCNSNPRKFTSITEGYKPTCGKVCGRVRILSNIEEDIKNGTFPLTKPENRVKAVKALEKVDWDARQVKSNKTNITRYGETSHMKSILGKEKMSEIFQEKYNANSPLGNATVRQKCQDTMMELYGYSNAFKSDNFLEKKKQTSLKKYGTDNPSKSPIVKDKVATTNNKLYGGHPAKLDQIKESKKKINLELFGDENIFKSDYFKEETRKTCMEKYGVSHSAAAPVIIASRAATRKKRTINAIVNNIDFPFIPQFDIETFAGVETEHDWKCKACDHIFSDELKGGLHCSNCMVGFRSRGEKELFDFIKSLGFTNLECNKRKRLDNKLEIDLFIPELNIGIEYSGNYYHSDIFVKKDYHLKKHQACIAKGIKLITIFEGEWVNKQQQVKDRLIHILKADKRKSLYARKSTIQQIDIKICSDFLKLYHLQGTIGSSIKYGAFIDDELVGVMTFGKLRKAM